MFLSKCAFIQEFCQLISALIIVLVCLHPSLHSVSGYLQSANVVDVHIDTNRVVQVVDDRFVGFTLDTTLIKDGWLHFDVSSVKLHNLAVAVSPCYLRVGGTSADRLLFNPNTTGTSRRWTDKEADEEYLESYKAQPNFTMSRTDWDMLNKFSSSVGWSLIFDLNVLLRKQDRWDPANAQLLLNYTQRQGYQVAGFQLGNEPNMFPHMFDVSVSAEQLAQGFSTLQQILRASSYFRDCIIVGPDTTQLNRKKTDDYFSQFLSSGGGKVVNKASFHHYYVNGRTTGLDDFLDPAVLDSLEPELDTALNVTSRLALGVEVWLGETSSAFGGGAEGLSDVYVAGFMWLDKLGLTARRGLKGILRQSFYKGNYALLDQKSLNPNPDYWLTVLYKRLVGGAVLSVNTSLQSPSLRLYAHCTNTHSVYGYPAGSVTLYGMNLLSHNTTISLSDFPGRLLHVYWLTPHSSLTSRKVKLNGKTLNLVDDNLPDMEPLKLAYSHVTLPAHTFGFIVVPDAGAPVCQNSAG